MYERIYNKYIYNQARWKQSDTCEVWTQKFSYGAPTYTESEQLKFFSLSCSSCFIPVSEVKLSDILRYFFLPVSSHIHIWSCLWGRKCDSFGEGRRKFCDLPYSFCFLKQIPNSTSNHQIFQVSFINFKFYPIIFNFICIEIDQWKNILNGRK